MKPVFQQDHVKLDASKVTEYKHPTFGDVTVFHDIVIASEIVQKYEDGRAYKSRDELELYAWTVDGRWVIVGSHPAEGIISGRDQVSGRTVNPRYVKDLNDPKTRRPCRAGVRSDVEIFNKNVPKTLLDDMKSGKKQEVSIGFFFTKDDTAGAVADGPFKGDEYDYVQRNMFHDHLAAGLENGRCPMPYCGLGADEITKNLTGDPFSGYPSFSACVADMTKPKDEGGQGYTEEQAEKVCGMLQAKHEKKKKKDSEMTKLARKFWEALMDEYEALKGEREAMKKTDKVEWWREIDWAEDEKTRNLFDALPEETRNLIIEAGLCPDCVEQMAEDLSLEEINSRITEIQTKKRELKDKIDEYWKQETPQPSPTTKLWEEVEELDKELTMLLNAKSFKIALGDEDVVDDDESLPYEDGEALDFTLTGIDKKPEPELVVDVKPRLDAEEIFRKAKGVV